MNKLFKELYKFNFKFGLKHILTTFSYERVHEAPEVIESLRLEGHNSLKILDVACGSSIYPLYLASKGHLMYVVDLNPKDIKWQEKKFKKMKLKVEALFEDCTRGISYPDSFFDRIYSISSIEHFSGMNGDVCAMQHISRVLKPNGITVISVPLSKQYRENIDSKEYIGNFSRYYDLNNIKERLIKPSNLKLLDIVVFGEKGFRFSKLIGFLYRYVPSKICGLFTPLFTIAAFIFVSRIKWHEIKSDRDYTAIITLRKEG